MSSFAATKEHFRANPEPSVSASSIRRINPSLIRDAVPIADCLLVITAGWISFQAEPVLANGSSGANSAFVAATILIFFALLTRARLPGVDEFVRQSGSRRVIEAMPVTLWPFCLTLALTFAFLPPASGADRGIFIRWQWIWASAALLATASNRVIVSLLVRRWQARGALMRRIAIVGHGDLGERLDQWLRVSYADTIELVGVFDDRERSRSPFPRLQQLVRGTTDDLIELSKQIDIDRIIVALPHSAERRVMAILSKLRCIPVDISLAPDLVGFAASSGGSAEFGGPPLVQVYGRPLEFWASLIKEAIDRALAAFGFAVFWPLFVLIAIVIKLDSEGPVLFKQNRHGLGNSVIEVYKFRTMYAELGDQGGERQAQRNDRRVTPIGRFLRRASLDELPQLLNVLRGEMSLVGPRALPVQMRVQDKLNYEIVSNYALRHRVKPGITGWAQVNGYRGAVETAEALQARVAHDLTYIENWSLWLDLRILFMTPRVAFGHKNAF
jgi:Undecaprenyl-phosphate glucose phosphotransferase